MDPQGEAPGGPPASESLQELRKLLLDPELERLEELERSVAQRELDAREVARVLGPAVRMSAAADQALAEALAPTIETSIDYSVRHNPKAIAEAIYPSLGPAIRKSIRHTLGSMVDGFQQVLRNAVSLRGLRWRIEASRTGRPFAEVVLMHSLVYRVEQAFLIHREDGVLLRHAVGPEVEGPDPDLVSAMLTAIRSFARDSFGGGPSGVELEQVELGDLRLEIAEGPRALLALAVRGVPPPDLRERLEASLERFHGLFTVELEDFAGDTSTFAAAHPLLETLLEQRLRTPRTRRGPYRAFVPMVVLSLILVAAVSVGVRHAFVERRHEAEFQELLGLLGAEPGIVVTRSERDGQAFRVTVLRDRLARPTARVAAELGLEPGRLEVDESAYLSFDDPLVARRCARVLAPPPGMELSVSGGVLTLRGEAPEVWLERARDLAPSLGVTSIVRAEEP